MISRQVMTFVFSDIEHSTKLAQKLGESYPEILEKHRIVIRKAIDKHHGREVDTAGDGFFMTFDHPLEAVLASIDIQRAFQTQPWATAIGLKVRMGIHTGIALFTKSGITGVEVHYAARICSAASGHQILTSIDTQKSLEQKAPSGFTLTSIGEYLLKDFSNPVSLFQINIPGLQNDFPSLRLEPEEKRIAVMPFINIKRDPDLAYIGEGLAEELIIAIGKIQGVRVVSRSLAFALSKTKHNPFKIGQKLNVSAVLEGRIKTRQDELKIDAELIDTTTGFNLWSGQYNSTRKNLPAIQDDIKFKIAEALDCEVITQQQDSIQKRQSHNAEAYDFYLRGRRFYLQYSNRGIALALQMFEKAIEADKNYALAYAGLADGFIYKYQHIKRTQSIIDRADEMSQRAIELAPAFPEVHVSRGIVLAEKGQFKQAEQSFQFAIESDPTLFWGWYHYARTCFAFGKPEKAARLFEQANRVEPEDYQSILLAAQVYEDLGSEELAKSMRKRGVELTEKCIELNPGDTRALYLGANGLALLQEPEKSLAFLQRALSLEPSDSMLLYNAGCIYALLGMKQEALHSLEKAFQAGLTLIGWYKNDSNLDSLRNEPRFVKLLEKLEFFSTKN